MSSRETKIGLSPFANWYTNSCSDIWSSPTFFQKASNPAILPENEYFKYKVNGLLAYGARNCVIKCQIHGTAIRFIGSVKAFPSIHEKVISVAYARCLKTPKLFIGSNLGSVLVYYAEKNALQTLNGVDLKPPALKFGSVIASADWADGNNVYYCKGCHVIQWNTENNTFTVADLTSPSGLKTKIDTIKVSRIDPLLLAVAFTGGQISVLKLDGISITNYSLLTTLNHGSDEITSMAFPFYHGDFTNGVLAAVSRNGWVKVWELDTRKILADAHFATKSETKAKSKNFFSLAFIPRPPPPSDLNETKASEEVSVESIPSDQLEQSESDISDTPEKSADKPTTKLFRHYLKLLASRADGKISLIDVPVDRRETKMSSLTRPLNVCGQKICHSNVVFNISVINPFHYTSSVDKRTIQPFWDEIKLLASSISLDRQIIIYDLQKLQSVRPVYPTLSLQVHDLDFYPGDYSKLLIACGDGLKIWHFNYNPHTHYKFGPTNYQVENVQHVPPATKIVSAAWHPKDKAGENLIGFGTDQGAFICVDLSKQVIVYTSEYKLTGSKTRVYSCKWGPIPSNYASSLTRNWACYTVYAAGSVRAHAVTDSKAFNLDQLSENKLLRRDINKTECVWKDDYNYIAVGYEDGQIIVCSNDGHFNPVILLEIHTSLVSCIRWHPDNIYQYDSKNKAAVVYKEKSKRECWLASGSNDITVLLTDLKMHLLVYHESKQKQVIHLTKPDKTLNGHQDRIVSISWNMVDEDLLASCSADTTVHVWHIDFETPVYVFYGHWSRVFAVSWAPWDSNLIFSGGDDSTVQVWSPSDLQSKNPPRLIEKLEDESRIDSSLPEVNQPSPCNSNVDQLLEPVLQETNNGDYDEQFSILELSNEHEIIEVSQILESTALDNVNFPFKISEKLTSASTESQNTPKLSPDEKLSSKPPSRLPSSRSSGHSSSNSNSIIGKLRNAERTMAEISYKEKKKSLLPRSNIMENCSTKVQTLRDIEFLLFKRYAVSGSPDNDDEELRQRNLIFLDKDEINELCQIEISNHKQNKNSQLAFQITALQGNLKEMIVEAVKTKELTDWMVSHAASISREFWAKTVLAYAQQLEKSGDSLQSALYYSAVHRIVDATRVLVKAGLYKEALILVKSRETYNSQLIKDILHAWAEVKQKDTNYEFAAKVYLANMEPVEASNCLGERLDDPKCQQLKRIIDSSKELKLDSEKDPDPPITEFGLNNNNNDLTIIYDS